MVQWYWQGNTEVRGEKNGSVQLYTPQISHGLCWDRTGHSAIRNLQLTALATARITYKYSVRTAQRTQCVSIRKTDQWIVYRGHLYSNTSKFTNSLSNCAPDVHLQSVTIPDAVFIKFDLLMRSTTLLETCRWL